LPRKIDGEWVTHQWIKKAVLLSFRVRDNRVQDSGATPLLRQGRHQVRRLDDEEQFRQGGFRVVPPAPSPARAPSSPRTPC
jgi:2,3,4,5-tetrahydropyridine-2-carboxylate N-succinyltransferase